jgi:hypothetical protein
MKLTVVTIHTDMGMKLTVVTIHTDMGMKLTVVTEKVWSEITVKLALECLDGSSELF